MQLPFVEVLPHRADLWVVGAHGGAGESALAAIIPGAEGTGHRWPHAPGASLPVVLAARSSEAGLRAAQAAAMQWAAGGVPGVELMGLVLMADAPGRLPARLRALAHVVSGGVAKTWRMPWIEVWRTQVIPDPQRLPKEASRIVDLLTTHLHQPKPKRRNPDVA